MKYVFLLILLPFLGKSQTTTFSSYFQTIESNKEIKVLHMPMCVTINNNEINVSVQIDNGTSQDILTQPVHWDKGLNCLISNLNKVQISYYPKINKLTVYDNNVGVMSTYYSQIPNMITIEK